MSRYARRDALALLDPEVDFAAIYRDVATLELPWDLNQALSLALFRTYAIPGVGSVLGTTGELTRRTQLRYDDTALLLGAVVEHGPESVTGRAAVRRVNQVHHGYDITNDDMLYVLATFVVVPARWMAAHAWRPFTATELRASVRYYERLGGLLGIHDVPGTYAEHEALLEREERARFGFSAGGRAVADATLELMTTFPPFHLLPAAVSRALARGLLDDPLLDALGYPRPSRAVRALASGAIRARSAVVRRLPVRRRPLRTQDLPQVRSHGSGFDVARIGSPAPGCPAVRAAT